MVVSVVEFGVSGGGNDDDERPVVVVGGDTGDDTVAVAHQRGGHCGDGTNDGHRSSHPSRRRCKELKALELCREERKTS